MSAVYSAVFTLFCLGAAGNVLHSSGTQIECPPIPVIDSTTTTPYWYLGNDFTIFQKVCTDTTVARFSPSWTRRPWSLSDACSGIVSNYTLSNSTEIRDGGITTCFTMSITIYNATSCPDTGQYTAAVSNKCGSKNETKFDVYVTDCPCNTAPKAILPPGKTRTFVLVWSQEPRNFTFNKLHYVGCSLSIEYSIDISRSGSLICKDPPSPFWEPKNYSCSRDSRHHCSFNMTFTIVNYSLDDNGEYCFQPTSSSWADGALVCPFNFVVLRWPNVTKVTTRNSPIPFVKNTIIWTIHNYSKDYNILEFTTNGRKIDLMRDGYYENVENTSDRLITEFHLTLPSFFEGYIQLTVNFTDDVQGYSTTFKSQRRSPVIKTKTWLSVIVVCAVVFVVLVGLAVTASGCSYTHYTRYRKERNVDRRSYERLPSGSLHSVVINGTEDVFSPPPVKAEPHTQSWTSYESIHQVKPNLESALAQYSETKLTEKEFVQIADCVGGSRKVIIAIGNRLIGAQRMTEQVARDSDPHSLCIHVLRIWYADIPVPESDKARKSLAKAVYRSLPTLAVAIARCDYGTIC